jgi:hypothetical protein
MTFLAVGFAAIGIIIGLGEERYSWTGDALLIVGGALIGTGAFWLTKRPWIGTLVGAAIPLAIVVVTLYRAFNVLMRM